MQHLTRPIVVSFHRTNDRKDNDGALVAAADLVDLPDSERTSRGAIRTQEPAGKSGPWTSHDGKWRVRRVEEQDAQDPRIRPDKKWVLELLAI